MKTIIDMKSLLLGLTLGLLTTVVVAAAWSPGQIGRFQIGGTGNQGLLLDTVTGQVWTSYFSSSGGMGNSDFLQPKIGDKK